MRIRIAVLFIFVLGILLPGIFARAQTVSSDNSVLDTPVAADVSDTYYQARVLRIIEEGSKEVEEGLFLDYQKIELEILDGDKRGEHITIDHGGNIALSKDQKVHAGERVILAKTPKNASGREVYYIIDTYRVNNIIIIALLFFASAIYFGRKRGLLSIVGLVMSVLVIFYYIIPRILEGTNPYTVCIIGAVIILCISLYISHGFNKRTTVALGASLISLALAVAVNALFVRFARLAGNGTEDVFYLQFGNGNIDLRGILLGGIILGVLGVLDDVTTSQTAAIEEISRANTSLTFAQLYQSGISVGREHIASLVNTLVLAYAGVSLPLLLLYSSQKNHPVLVTINSAFLSEEIVRTLVGSTVLVLAVPITTMLAARVYASRKNK